MATQMTYGKFLDELTVGALMHGMILTQETCENGPLKGSIVASLTRFNGGVAGDKSVQVNLGSLFEKVSRGMLTVESIVASLEELGAQLRPDYYTSEDFLSHLVVQIAEAEDYDDAKGDAPMLIGFGLQKLLVMDNPHTRGYLRPDAVREHGLDSDHVLRRAGAQTIALVPSEPVEYNSAGNTLALYKGQYASGAALEASKTMPRAVLAFPTCNQAMLYEVSGQNSRLALRFMVSATRKMAFSPNDDPSWFRPGRLLFARSGELVMEMAPTGLITDRAGQSVFQIAARADLGDPLDFPEIEEGWNR